MFVRDRDFVCESTDGLIRCLPKVPIVASAYKVLQLQLVRLLPQLPEPPDIEIAIDGIIGPSTVLATQMILTRLGQTHPQIWNELGDFITAPPERSIEWLATIADQLTGYLDAAVAANPSALVQPNPPRPPADEEPLDWVKRVFTKSRVLAGGATLLGFGSLLLISGAIDRRALGVTDRSHFLPASDGTDSDGDDGDFDGSDDDGDEGSDDADPLEQAPSVAA